MKKIYLLFSISFLIFSKNSLAISLQDVVVIAKNNSKVILAENYKLEAAKSLKKEAQAEFLPEISIDAQYGNRRSNSIGSRNKYGDNKVEELKIEQPIFDGFGSVSRYKEAGYKIDSATSKNNSKKHSVVLNAINAYCDLYRYQETSALQEENTKRANEIYKLALKRQKSRVMDNSDLIKFKYELANSKTRYFEAQSRYQRARYEYRNAVGEVHIDLSLPKIKKEIFDERNAIERAFMNNQDLKSYRFDYFATKQAYKAEKSTFSPKISAIASVSRQKNSLFLEGQRFENRSAFLNLSVPLFQKGIEYSNLSKASNVSAAAKQDYEVAKDDLIEKIGSSIQEYELNYKLNKSNKDLVVMAKDRLRIMKKRLKAGSEDVIEVLRAAIDLRDREVDLINSEADLVKSYYQIKLLLGEI